MKLIDQLQGTSLLSLFGVPAPLIRPERLLVQTAFSLISPGTERAKVEVAKTNLPSRA